MLHQNIFNVEFISSSDVNGMQYAPLDHATGDWNNDAVGFSCLTRFDRNVKYPELTLLGPVEYLILEGGIKINGKECRKGDYIKIQEGDVSGEAGPTGCLILCSYKDGLKIK